MLFLLLFIIDLNFFYSCSDYQIFVPTAELVIPTGIPTNEANAEIETKKSNY